VRGVVKKRPARARTRARVHQCTWGRTYILLAHPRMHAGRWRHAWAQVAAGVGAHTPAAVDRPVVTLAAGGNLAWWALVHFLEGFPAETEVPPGFIAAVAAASCRVLHLLLRGGHAVPAAAHAAVDSLVRHAGAEAANPVVVAAHALGCQPRLSLPAWGVLVRWLVAGKHGVAGVDPQVRPLLVNVLWSGPGPVVGAVVRGCPGALVALQLVAAEPAGPAAVLAAGVVVHALGTDVVACAARAIMQECLPEPFVVGRRATRPTCIACHEEHEDEGMGRPWQAFPCGCVAHAACFQKWAGAKAGFWDAPKCMQCQCSLVTATLDSLAR
jgi:hypothetical protein